MVVKTGERRGSEGARRSYQIRVDAWARSRSERPSREATPSIQSEAKSIKEAGNPFGKKIFRERKKDKKQIRRKKDGSGRAREGGTRRRVVRLLSSVN